MSVSRKVQMGSGSTGGAPWTFDEAQFVGGTGNNNSYKYEVAGNDYAVGIVFSDDGTKMIMNINDNTASGAYFDAYTLSNAWDMDSATRDSRTLIPTGSTSAPRGLLVNNDGTKFYFIDSGFTRLYQVEFATAWDPSSSQTLTTITSVVDPASTVSDWIGMFNSDGSVYYVINDTGTAIKVFNLTTNYELSTGVTAGTDITSISGKGLAAVGSQTMSSDGNVLYLQDNNLKFTAVDMTTPYDLSTLDWNTKTSNANYGANLGSTQSSQMGYGASVYTDSSTVTRIFTCGGGVTSAIYNGAASASSLSSIKLEMPSRVYTPPMGPASYSSTEPFWGPLWTITGINFNADGSKLLIARHLNDSVDPYYLYEETLSTPYNVGTSSYSTSGTNFFSISNLGCYSQNWSEDGLNLFSIFSGANLRCFNYSTAFDPSSYVNFDYLNRYTRASAIDNASSMMFNDAKDELTLAMYGPANTSTGSSLPYPMPPGLYTLPLGTTGDISTVDTSGLGVAIVSETGDPNDYYNAGLEFNSTGSSYISLNFNGDYAKTFTPPNAYGVTTYDSGSKTLDLIGPYNDNLLYFSSLRSFSFNNDGTKAYLLDQTLKCIRIYSLSTPYDVSDIRLNDPGKPDNTWRQTDQNTTTYCLTMNPTGTKLYQASSNKVTEYSLSTAWDLSTTSATANATLSVTSSSFGGDIAWGNSGYYLFRLSRTAGILERYAASTPYDLGSCGSTPDKTFTFGTLSLGSGTSQDKMFLKPDGSAVYTYAMSYNSNTEYIFQWNMSTAWDPTTIASTTTPDNYKTMSLVNDDWAAGIWIKSDGSKLFVAQQTALYRFDFGTNWDPSTLPTTAPSSDDRYNTAYAVGSVSGTNGLFVDSTGTKMFRGMDATGGSYILKTEFGSELDFKTMTHDGGSHVWYWADPVLDGTVPRTIAFGANYEFRWKPDGTSIYIQGQGSTNLAYPQAYYSGSNLLIHQFNLSTAWDLSTATHYDYTVVTSSVSATGTNSFDISSNGEHVIIAYGGNLYMATLSTPWDISTATGGLPWTAQTINGNTWGTCGLVGNDVCAIRWHPSNGNAIYARGAWGNVAMYTHKINLSTEYDPTTASIAIEGTAKHKEVVPTGYNWPLSSGSVPFYSNLMFKDGGNYLYMLQKETFDANNSTSTADKYIHGFSLSTPYDITTATQLTSFKFQYSSPPDGQDFTNNSYYAGSGGYFEWNSNGTRFFIVNNGNLIGEYKV